MTGTEAAVAADVPPVRLSQRHHDTSLRAFLRVTTVRQAVLLFLGSLLYDIGSIAYLFELFAGAVCFIIASASFVFSVALDVKQIEEQNEEAKRSEPDVAAVLMSGVWLRRVVLLSNLAGGAITFLASVAYVRASLIVDNGLRSEKTLHRGDILFCIGMWLFVLGFALAAHETRIKLVKLARIREVPANERGTFLLFVAYTVCLCVFGIASTIWVLPSPASQFVGTALFVVSNVAFTLLSGFALYSLWKEHRRSAMHPEDLEAAGGVCVVEGASAGDATASDRADELSPSGAVSSPPRISAAERDAAVLVAAKRALLEVAGFLRRSKSARRALAR